jgi:L-2-hydroxyglutarate oxidase LhgO
MLYDFCQNVKVPHQKCGKWVVAVNEGETDALAKIFDNAKLSGVSELKMLSKKEIAEEKESHLRAAAVLLSQESGIVSVHGLLQAVEALGRSRGSPPPPFSLPPSFTYFLPSPSF